VKQLEEKRKEMVVFERWEDGNTKKEKIANVE
jgi:hypothetical protein